MRHFDRLTAFIRLGRPLFLVGGLLYHALGAALAYYDGAAIRPLALILGQITISAVQLMTHYSNEYFDLEADRANPTPTRWAGSSQVLPRGELAPRVALIAALACGGAAVAMLPVLALVLRTGPLPLLLIAVGIGLAWFYSAPPLRLNWRGLGEIAVAIVVPGLTPLVGYSLHARRLRILSETPLPLLAVLPVMLLQVATQLTLNIPDAAGDACAGKRTLAVQLGAQRAARLHLMALALAYGSLPLLAGWGLPPLAAGLVALTGLIGVWQGWRVGRGAFGDPAGWDSLGFWGLALPVAAGLAQVVVYAGLVDWALRSL